jgi:hypothetical protein
MTGFLLLMFMIMIFWRVKAVRNEKTPSNDVRDAMGERAANIDRKPMNKMKQVSQSML